MTLKSCVELLPATELKLNKLQPDKVCFEK